MDDINQLLDDEAQVDADLAKPGDDTTPASVVETTPSPTPPPAKPKKAKSKTAIIPEAAAPDQTVEAEIKGDAEVIAEVEDEGLKKPDDLKDDTKAEEKPAETPRPKESSIAEKGVGKKLSGHIILQTTDNPLAKWYVIHTYSGHEARVAENLKQRVQSLGLVGHVMEMFIPTQDKIEIRSGKKYTVTEKIFPGYLLVRMILDDPTWLAVRTTPGVTGFVGTGSQPIPLSDLEVSGIQKFATIGAPKFKTKFSVGEAVRITDGPFADYMGSVSAIDEERGRLKVLVSIFGRETPVELDFLQVTKI